MKAKSALILRIALSIILICASIIFIHTSLDSKNRNNCMSKAKSCDNGVKRYTYTSKYIGECDCTVICQ